MTVRARLAMVKASPAGAAVSYGHTWTADAATSVGLVPVGYGDGVPRHASNVAEVAVDGKRRPIRGRVCMDQFVVDLGGDLPAAGSRGGAVRRPVRGPAHRPGLGRGQRHHQLRDRHPDRGADDPEARRLRAPHEHAGWITRIAERRRRRAGGRRCRRRDRPAAAGDRRRAGDGIPFGSLRSSRSPSSPTTAYPARRGGRRPDGRRSAAGAPTEADVTVVFVHGYAWTSTAGTSSAPPTAAWSARSSTTSARTAARAARRATRDHRPARPRPEQVIDAVAPEGPVVLIGHSMGGMPMIALAEQHPELIGDRVIGVGLISTTAGGLDPSRILLPMLPARLTGRARAGRSPRWRAATCVDGRAPGRQGRRAGRHRQLRVRRRGPRNCVEFVDQMLSSTPFDVVAEFFPSFGELDKFDGRRGAGEVPTAIICGTDRQAHLDRHRRKLHERIPGSRCWSARAPATW